MPPQTIDSGVARVQVVEGFVDKIVVQPGAGEGTYAINTIKEYASQIKGAGAVNVKNLERELLIINDLPGVKARSVLSPSKTTKGAADLLIIVERKPYDALLTLDNYGSRYLGRTQLGAAATLNSMLGLNEAISTQVVYAPRPFVDERELAYGALSYEMPVGPYGTKVSVLGSITDTEPGWDLEEFDAQGRSQLLQFKATQPFIRARSTNLIGRLLFDLRNVKSENNVEEDRKDHIRALRAGMRYEFLDQFLGIGFNVVDVEIAHGLNVFGASDEGDDNLICDLADPQFNKIEIELQRLHRLNESFNLLLAVRRLRTMPFCPRKSSALAVSAISAAVMTRLKSSATTAYQDALKSSGRTLATCKPTFPMLRSTNCSASTTSAKSGMTTQLSPTMTRALLPSAPVSALTSSPASMAVWL